MEIFSALLAFWAGNSPVTGEFHTQRPVTRSFDVFFDLGLNERLSKQSWGWWFETPSCSLWRHCNDDFVLQLVKTNQNESSKARHEWSFLRESISDRRFHITKHDDVIKWKHFPRYWPFVRGIHRSPVNSPHKGQWRGALMFSLIWAWMNGWVNNREAGDLRRYRAHYDITVMGLVMRIASPMHGVIYSTLTGFGALLTASKKHHRLNILVN